MTFFNNNHDALNPLFAPSYITTANIAAGSITTTSAYTFSNPITGNPLGTSESVETRDILEKIAERLAILTSEPDLEKLNKFAALKLAYDQYMMLDALCNENKNP